MQNQFTPTKANLIKARENLFIVITISSIRGSRSA